MAIKKSLKVLIKDTQKIIFEGDAERVSSFNEVGSFDVLPMHANFISMINKELVIYKNKQRVKEVKVDQAIMKVKQDSVKVFLGIEQFDLSTEIPSGTEPSK